MHPDEVQVDRARALGTLVELLSSEDERIAIVAAQALLSQWNNEATMETKS